MSAIAASATPQQATRPAAVDGMAAAEPALAARGSAGSDSDDELLTLCIEETESLMEPLCDTDVLRRALVPYVLSHSLQSAAFLKMPKPARQARLKALTQMLLSGEYVPEQPGEQPRSAISPQSFWAHLRAKYGTRQQHIELFLSLLEPQLRGRRVRVLRFEGEVAVPSASLLVRASGHTGHPAAAAGGSLSLSEGTAAPHRHEFARGAFDAAALARWLAEDTRVGRAPPLWPHLLSSCGAATGRSTQALILFAEPNSTETSPEALELAARCLHARGEAIPYISCVTFGPKSSEHLAALEELCAWSGGLSLNVDDAAALKPAAEGLMGHQFGWAGQPPGLRERREYYARKQALKTCFLPLPCFVMGIGSSDAPAGDRHVAPPSGEDHADSVAVGLLSVLNKGNRSGNFNGTLPSEAMLAVLSDVSMDPMRRWGRSLRSWRMQRGLRDVVFSEQGNLGLEFDEPDLGDDEDADSSRRCWRLRATHPPASSLKMQPGSELIAINQVQVDRHTLRSEVSRRIAARPVSLTFRTFDNDERFGEATLPFGGAMLAMATAEIVVSELREGWPPLKTSAPPLSTALQRVKASASSPGGARNLQAQRLLAAVADWGPKPGVETPAWIENLSSQGSTHSRLQATSSTDALSTNPALLLRSLLFCGEVAALARAGLACCRWRWLLLEGVQEAKRPQRRLWTWTLRWGQGPSHVQRVGFWRWALRGLGDQQVAPMSSPTPSGEPLTPKAQSRSLLEVAYKGDAAGLLTLSQGLGGACLGPQLATTMLGRIAKVVGDLPQDLLEALLQGPYHLQRLWLLSGSALPWLVMQCRHFQVLLAAHHSNVFKHLFAEGVAPELFYCSWVQELLHGAVPSALLLRLWDVFVFERSHKVFLKAAVALFGLLTKSILGKDDERIMKTLFDSEEWQLPVDSLHEEVFRMKVTRSMLHDIERSQ